MEYFYIGIDLGGTNIRAITSGNRIKNEMNFIKRSVEKNDDVIVEVENNIVRIIEDMCIRQQREGKVLGGIGIAMAALFDEESGIITSWPNNTKWSGFPIRSYLEKHYKVKVALIDDANAAALGEQAIGKFRHLIYMTISTGIGCGIIMNNTLLTGAHGWAGEVGHIKVTEDNIICTCGAKGCLQAVASGPAILRNFKEGIEYNTYIERQYFDVVDIASLARSGVNEANECFQRAGKYIGDALANLVMILDIPNIVLGGGVIEAGDLIIQPIIHRMRETIQNRREFYVHCSTLKDKNAVYGALALIERMVGN